MGGVFHKRLQRMAIALVAVATTLGGAAGTAVAQRSPTYEVARQQGLIGERVDGYLGYVGPPSADLRALVEDINIRRRAVYADKAKVSNATVEEYALTSGCLAIARTRPGEKYQAPDGAWRTRSDEPPVRDRRCP